MPAPTLLTNQLLDATTTPDSPLLLRVLHILLDDGVVWLFEVTGRHAWPECQPLSVVLDGISSGALTIQTHDPFIPPLRREEDISPAQRTRRDWAYSIIQPMVDDPEYRILDRQHRASLVTAALDVHASAEKDRRLSRVTVHTYLRRFWRGGQSKSALILHFDRCGGPGQPRAPGKEKRGRPSRLYRADSSKPGINLTAALTEQLRVGFKRFFRQRGKRSWKRAYLKTMASTAEFRSHWRKVRGPDGRERLVIVLRPKHERPTIGQFKYANRDHDKVATNRTREGAHHHNLRNRPRTGTQNGRAYGPGSLFEIDATTADLHLLSDLNPAWVIGRPTLYVVVDAWSWLIVGFYAGFEPPSWAAAMLALQDAFLPKAAFCRAAGLSLGSGEGLPYGIRPTALCADRGMEHLGKPSDHAVDSLQVRWETAAPFRADWKPCVEGTFRLLNHHGLHELPGAAKGLRRRGDRDPLHDAALNLQLFNELMITLIDYHNHHWRVPRASLDPELARAGVPPYPIDLWRWGCDNRPGHLHRIDREHVRVNLLPGGLAVTTSSRDGLSFGGLDYVPPKELLHLMLRDAGVGSRSFPVAHDLRDSGVLYLRGDHGRLFVQCPLHPRFQQFAGVPREVVRHFLEQGKLSTARAESSDEQAWVEHDSALADIARRGRTLRMTVMESTGAPPTTHNRRTHRELERLLGSSSDRIRRLLPGETGGAERPALPSRIPDDGSYVAPSNDLELFEQLSDVDRAPDSENQS